MPFARNSPLSDHAICNCSSAKSSSGDSEPCYRDLGLSVVYRVETQAKSKDEGVQGRRGIGQRRCWAWLHHFVHLMCHLNLLSCEGNSWQVSLRIEDDGVPRSIFGSFDGSLDRVYFE